jgi:hypothetical protein
MVEQDLLHLTIDGYLLVSSFCRQNLQRKGVCIFVKKVTISKKLIFCITMKNRIWKCAIHIETNTLKVIILSLYRALPGDFNQFLRGLVAVSSICIIQNLNS